MKNTERLQIGGTLAAYYSMRIALIKDIEAILRTQIDNNIAVKAAPGFADAFINSLLPSQYNTHKSGNFRSLNKCGKLYRQIFLDVMTITEPAVMKAKREKNTARRNAVLNIVFGIGFIAAMAYIAIQVAIS